nr:MAG TPA: hypothetical protein [Caudoviricetes sp.]
MFIFSSPFGCSKNKRESVWVVLDLHILIRIDPAFF